MALVHPWAILTENLHKVARSTRLALQPQPRGIHVDAQATYQQINVWIQRHLLMLQVFLSTLFSSLFGIQVCVDTWINRIYSPTLFGLYWLRIVLVAFGTVLLIRQQRIWLGWALLIGLDFLTTLVIIVILHDPLMLIFELFSTASAAVILPWWSSLLLVTVMVSSTHALLLVYFDTLPENWGLSALIFCSLMFGFTGIGVVMQRVLHQFATRTVEKRQEAIRRAAAEQQLTDMQQRARQMTLLKHDLRQPLRAVQGQLMGLEVSPFDQQDVIQPALAAIKRAERLISNLLDQARWEAQQPRIHAQPTDVMALFARLQAEVPGLARYYTDPQVEVRFHIEPLPLLLIDAEQLERAVLNLLDNALTHANRWVSVHAYATAEHVIVDVADDGPGIPSSIKSELGATAGISPKIGQGLGLLQVKAMLTANGGSLTFPFARATLVRMRLPLATPGAGSPLAAPLSERP